MKTESSVLAVAIQEEKRMGVLNARIKTYANNRANVADTQPQVVGSPELLHVRGSIHREKETDSILSKGSPTNIKYVVT